MPGVRQSEKVRATESLFVGKKSYIDKLQDEAGNVAYHIRMKSIPSNCLLHTVAKKYDRDPMKLYEALYRGQVENFDLTSAGNCCFKTTKSHEVFTTRIERKVCFPDELDLFGFIP